MATEGQTTLAARSYVDREVAQIQDRLEEVSQIRDRLEEVEVRNPANVSRLVAYRAGNAELLAAFEGGEEDRAAYREYLDGLNALYAAYLRELAYASDDDDAERLYAAYTDAYEKIHRTG